MSSINYIDYELKNLKIGDQPIKIIINKQVQEKLNEYKELIKKRMWIISYLYHNYSRWIILNLPAFIHDNKR